MRSEYVPVRKMRDGGSSLGMNRPTNGKRFGRVDDAFKHSSAYWGERREWYVVAAQTRDTDTLGRSNFRSLLKLLGGEGEGVAIERASHWAVGYVEYLLVRPDNRKGLRAAILAHSSVSDYAILDESDWSELESEEDYELAESELSGYEGWYEIWEEESDRWGSGEEANGMAVEEARKRLEELQPLWDNHAASAIDPAQGKLFDGIGNRVL